MTSSTRTHGLVDAYRGGGLSRREFLAGALRLGCSLTGAAALLQSCHKSPKATPARLSGRVQLLVGFDGGNAAPQRQVQQALAQAFIAEHPQVGIDFLRATSAAAAQTQLMALIARGASPDIVLGLGLADVSRLVDQHLWLDLRPLFDRDGISTGAFQSQAMAATRLSSYYGATKAIPGVPLGLHDHALAYNVELFSNAGLVAPPTSWSDSSWTFDGAFLQAAQTLTVDHSGKHAGQPGFDAGQIVRFGVGRVRPESVVLGFGGHFYDESGRRALLDKPAAVAGAQFAGDLITKYRVHPTASEVVKLSAGAPSGTEDQAAWRAGKLAMIEMCSCELDGPLGSKVPFAWKAAPIPAGPGGRRGSLEVSVGAIVAASPHHDLAWEVMKFFAVDPVRQRQLAFDGFGAVPALKTNVDAFGLGVKQALGVDPAVWVGGLASSVPDSETWIPAFGEVHDLMRGAFGQIAGGSSAATVMPQLQLQAQAKIDAWFRANKLPR